MTLLVDVPKKSQNPAKFGGIRTCGSGNVMFW